MTSITKNNNFPNETLSLISPGDNSDYMDIDWDIKLFKGIPLFSSIPILNRWKLDNEKCKKALLNQILLEIEKENNR